LCPGRDLDALGDHEVDTRGDGRPSLLDRPDLDRDLYVTRMGRVNVGCRIAPEENQEWDTRIETCLDRTLRDVFKNEVDAERPGGQRPHSPDQLTKIGHAETAGAEHATAARVRDRRHNVRPGARAKPGRQDRVFDPEALAELRLEHELPLLLPATCPLRRSVWTCLGFTLADLEEVAIGVTEKAAHFPR